MVSTIIIRHRKENRKKCSLTPLEGRPDFAFYSFPGEIPDVTGYILLDFDGPPLTTSDPQKLILLDGTWRYAASMRKSLPDLPVRRIPDGFVTAYPRVQTACSEPDAGLASIEALYIAYRVLGADPSDLLDHYYWKDAFLQKNNLV